MEGRTAVRRTIRGGMVVGVLALAAAPLHAGDGPAPSVVPGERIRIEWPGVSRLTTGEVVEAGPEKLRLRLQGRTDPVEVRVATVTRLERSLGRRSSAGKGALVGTLGGLAVGLGVSVATYGNSDCDGSCTPYAVIVTTAFAGAGSLVGVISGALIKTERWERVSLGHIGLSVAPRPRGGALALTVRF